MSTDNLHKYPGNLKQHKVEPFLSDSLYEKLCEARRYPGQMITHAWDARLQQWITAAMEQEAELQRLRGLLYGPTARRQFPDGSVPGNSEEAAAGWMRIAEERGSLLEEATDMLYEGAGYADEVTDSEGADEFACRARTFLSKLKK